MTTEPTAPVGAKRCPCCSGATAGDFWALCDVCTEASLAGKFPHDCDRLWDAPAGTGSPTPAPDVHNDNCGSCCCCSVDTDRLRAELSQVQKERDALEELRMTLVMALCTEDDDEERSDEEIVARVRELSLLATDETLTLDRVRRDLDEAQRNLDDEYELRKATEKARDAAESALAALRTEVGKIAADFDRQSTTAITAPARHIWTRAADAVRALVTDQSPAAPPDPDPASDHERFPPDGCRYCGWEQRSHGRIWTAADGIGWHSWTPPSDAQRLERMRHRAGLSPTSDTQTEDGGS